MTPSTWYTIGLGLFAGLLFSIPGPVVIAFLKKLSVGQVLILLGIGMACTGIAVLTYEAYVKKVTIMPITFQALGWGMVAGIALGAATAVVLTGYSDNVNLSMFAPLYNSNTIWLILIGMFVLNEKDNVRLAPVLVAGFLSIAIVIFVKIAEKPAPI
jgi:drug/metabolite transporter (DMT)-like permease